MHQIDRKMDRETRRRIGFDIGAELSKIHKESGVDHVCSAIIGSGAVEIITGIVDILSKGESEFLKSRECLFHLLNSRFVFEAFKDICQVEEELNTTSIMNNPYKTNCDLPHELGTDLMSFCLWCVYHGAESSSVRRLISSRNEKKIRELDKMRGYGLWLAIIARASIAYGVYCRKVLLPACEELLRAERGINESVNMNTFAAAFSTVKKHG